MTHRARIRKTGHEKDSWTTILVRGGNSRYGSIECPAAKTPHKGRTTMIVRLADKTVHR
jgi:hypothetical protein